MLKKILFTLIVFIVSLNPVIGEMPMDGILDIFYVNYRHPFIQEGRILLGNIIVQNNNPNGFTLKLISNNSGLLQDADNPQNSSTFDYTISIEEAGGHIGDGVVTNYTSSSLVSEYTILQTTNQLSYTDINLKVFVELTGTVPDDFLAGRYRDEVQVIYENEEL